MIPSSPAERAAFAAFKAGRSLPEIARALLGPFRREDEAAALELANEFLDAIDFGGVTRVVIPRKSQPAPDRADVRLSA